MTSQCISNQSNKVFSLFNIATSFVAILLVFALFAGKAHALELSNANWNTKPLTDSELETLTQRSNIAELHLYMKAGKLSVTQLTQFYLNKISTVDTELNSVIVTNPNAIKRAALLDAQLSSYNDELPSLYGMPIVVKDNIETKDMPTTAGSLALKNNSTGRDAFLIKKLREAGAIILGKTNLSEWANFRSERSSSGWSAVGGQTKNPFDTSRTPCGSSSGSAVAVAANLAIAAIGTETDGSITCPSAVTGIVGVKPTVGLVSRHGIVPISPTQDTAGPMTKNIADAQRILFVIQGEDPLDSKTLNTKSIHIKKLPGLVAKNRLRLGIIYSSAEQHEQVQMLFSEQIKRLKAQGIEVVEGLKFKPYDGFWDDSYSNLLREFQPALNQYFANLPNDLPDEINSLTLEKVIEFNLEHKDKEMLYFQQEIFDKALAAETIDTKKHKNTRRKLKTHVTEQGIDRLLSEHKLDGIIAVTRGPAWKIDLVNGDNSTGGVSSYSAIAGYPHVTLPFSKLHGLPLGLSIMTGYGKDQKALAIANTIESLMSN